MSTEKGITHRDGFGEAETSRAPETASTAVAAQATAAVQARYVMALKRPRDLMEVRTRLLAACKRPRFAETARYSKPVGGRAVEGPSIRFVEEAIRCLGNIYAESTVVYDDAEQRIVRVAGTDLESNVTYPVDVVVRKTVERSTLKQGQTALSERMNSRGVITYTVAATDDDLINKQAALVSKALRTIGLRLLPGDLLEEAMEAVIATQHDAAARDPDAQRKAVCDAFLSIGVRPRELADYLGHPSEVLTPAEVIQLRAVYSAIRDGEATWQATIEQKRGKPVADAPPAKAGGSADAEQRAAVSLAIDAAVESRSLDALKAVAEDARRLGMGTWYAEAAKQIARVPGCNCDHPAKGHTPGGCRVEGCPCRGEGEAS